MSRWHTSCEKPDVWVDTNGSRTPRCLACKAHLDLRAVIDQQQDGILTSEIPPDEPFGKMNLHWPGCVPYKRISGAEGMNPVDTAAPEPKVTSASLQKIPAWSILPIYQHRLAVKEFRLVHMSASDGNDSPIHITLEICQDDEFPDYETVSYAWGGESDDNKRGSPVCIGEYWDVKFAAALISPP